MPLWICDSGIVGCAAADKADRAAVAARRRILNVRTTGLTVLRGSAISGFVPVTSGWRFGIRDSRFGPTPESRVANPESRSLVTERFNRIQLRGLRRRINSEDHAQNRAEAEGDGYGPERRVHGRQLQQSLEGQARRRRAPMALRMPISRVRSVTETSMMFMMPMPPTRRAMPTTAPMTTVVVVSALEIIFRISSCASTRKSFF